MISTKGSIDSQGFDILFEERLLDDIEKSTKRLHQQSKKLNAEANNQNILIDTVVSNSRNINIS